MRIGLNLLHALPEIGGAWNYIANLLAALSKWDVSNRYVAFVTRESEPLVPRHSNFTAVPVSIRSKIRVSRILYENTLLHRRARDYRLDCIHWFANTGAIFNAIPGLVTVYDLMVFATPESFHWTKRLYLQMLIRWTARRAAMLLPMSETTAQDLVRIGHADLSRIIVVPPILDSRFKPAGAIDIRNLKMKYALPDQFWLYVAHFYPHKNHLRLLQAYQRLKSEGFSPWPLVLCGDYKGSEEAITSAITEFNLESDVLLQFARSPRTALAAQLDVAEMAALYSAASAQIVPSLFEGAGMPVLEAIACGCPLAVSAIPAFHEFAGEAALYFDPKDVDAMGQSIVTFQQDPELRTKLRALGLARSAEFTPKTVVDRLLEAYTKTVQQTRAATKNRSD